MRKTDIVLERWEAITDADDLRGFRHLFDERDKLAAQNCGCGHPFSSHTGHLREGAAMRVDDAMLGKMKQYDIFSDKPAGESGCNDCDCRQWKPANY